MVLLVGDIICAKRYHFTTNSLLKIQHIVENSRVKGETLCGKNLCMNGVRLTMLQNAEHSLHTRGDESRADGSFLHSHSSPSFPLFVHPELKARQPEQRGDSCRGSSGAALTAACSAVQ